ncbi:MAG: flagellar basal body P-ring protein FlgI [Planctomycetes bacterium]|nr:flagellar basal body P-ring protein FlgI [Planctomycetota bacterium]
MIAVHAATMRRRTAAVLAAVGLLAMGVSGCLPGKLNTDNQEQARARQVPPEIAGTVGEYAAVLGGGSLLLDGHGLVVGLGKNGSGEVPPRLKKYLVEYMLKRKVGSAIAGTRGVTPSQMIADKDTAVVRMVGVVPPGAPRGWIFDVRVTALSRTGTRSLDGGILYPFPMFLATGEGVPPSTGARAWAMAEGSIFVNPFLDAGKPSDAARFREGRLIGGGRVLEDRPLRLMLREPDYARCNVIQRRINQRFGQNARVANARNPGVIELTVPPQYRNDYEHFLELVTHLPLQSRTAQWEARARDIVEEMKKPGANYAGLALVWEAMGSDVVGVCREMYSSPNRAAAFYAARTGIRLNDRLAGDVLLRLAGTANAPFQIPAIEELGRQSWYHRSVPVLRRLLDDKSVLVRIAAYEALVRLGDTSRISRVHVGDEFDLDLVASHGSYLIYATQSRVKKIVLFGRDMSISRHMFFDMAGGMVTMADKDVYLDAQGDVVDPTGLTPQKRDALKKDRRLMVFRVIPRTGGISEPFYIPFLVRSLVQVLGQPAERDADGKIKGLEMTYGQVVSVLFRLCRHKDIPARFVLQPPPGRARIYRGAGTVGRPDMPGQ